MILFEMEEREQVFIGKQKDDLDGAAVPTPYLQQFSILLHRHICGQAKVLGALFCHFGLKSSKGLQ